MVLDLTEDEKEMFTHLFDSATSWYDEEIKNYSSSENVLLINSLRLKFKDLLTDV
jgi:hypothetical protein